MKLYSFGRTRSYKCVWLINELNIDCDIQEVNLYEGEQEKEPFLSINPFGKVPVLEDGDLILHEASAILNYLADKFHEKDLIPEPRTKSRAVYDKWSYFMANEMECHLWAIEKNSWRYEENERSELAIENSKKEFKAAVKILDRELQNKNFLIDNKFSVADISLAYLLRWAKLRELLSETHHLNSYLENLITREHYPQYLFDKK